MTQITQTLTVTYNNKTATFNVTISNEETETKAPYKLTAVKGETIAYRIEVNDPNPLTNAVLTLACYDPATDRMAGYVRKELNLSAVSDLSGELAPPEGAEDCAMTLSLMDLSTGVSLCEAARISAS